MPWRKIYWTAFVAALAVYGAMIFWTLPAIIAAAGGQAPFDLRPVGYFSSEARAFLAALSDEGRAIYLGPQRLLDMFYPALLAIVLFGAVQSLVRPALLRRLLLAAVLGGMVADYAENHLVRGLLLATGPLGDDQIMAANWATVIKSFLTGLSMLAVLAALVLALVRRGRGA